MSNEGGNEDRLTMSEFAELIQHLSVQEILTIEYRVGTNWNKLFARKSVLSHAFVCNLCVLEASSFKSLLSHIDGRKHTLQMERVKQLYHPDYTYPKNYKNESGSKTKKNVPVSCTINDHDQTQSKVVNKECQDNSKNETLQNKEQIKLLVVTNVDPKIVADTATINKHKKLCHNTRTPTPTESPKEKIKSLNFNNDINNYDEINNVKNLLTKDREEINTKKISSVVAERRSMSKEEDKEKKSKIVVIPEKRSLPDKNMEEVEVKKSKIVCNSASALSLKENTESVSGEKNKVNRGNSRYQTDKIIIPTVHKNKLNSEKSSPHKILNDLPKFVVKSYSSKPSDNDIYGILGVEYVIKIMKSRSDVSPRYECGLCELILDGFAMQKHLEGYNHRLKFCEKHFPTAMRHYRIYMQHVPESELFKVMTPVLAKLAIAIEQHHGRNLPYECYERDFNINRHEILAKAFSCRHASEQYGPTFTHVVSSKEIDEFINNRHNYLPPSSSRCAIFDIKTGSSSGRSDIRHQNSRTIEKESNSKHRHAGRENCISDVSTSTNSHKSYMSSGLHNEIYLPSGNYNQANNRNNVQQVDDETYNLMVDDFIKGTLKGFSGNSKLRDHSKRATSPEPKSLSPSLQNDIWQSYRQLVDKEMHNIEERFKQYRKDPETHPSYNEEWQKFWKRRKDELVSAGLDHRKYNYQPEWVRFIKIRIEELYGQDVENIKIKSRERLCLPMSNDNVPDVKYHVQAPILGTLSKTITSSNNAGAATKTSTSLPSLHLSNDNIPQVVSVLRLMTALEDSLGSLGPKIISLLTKALHAEKNNPSYVNAIILNDDNCSLIETAKEKFKGLIITGLFEGSKKRVLKQVVNDAEELLKYAHQFCQQLASQRSSIESSINQTQKSQSFLFDPTYTNISATIQNQSSQSVTSNTELKKSHSTKTDITLSRVDKKELASKLAASLVAQGKTDFDPQQLQQLIAVYKLIENKKRENAETALSNKNSSSLSESFLASKKTLSDTLSDLLKTPSTSNDSKTLKTSQSALEISNQIFGSRQFSLNVEDSFQQKNSDISTVPQNCVLSNSLTSILRDSNDYYFNNTTQSITNTYGANCGGKNLVQQRQDYELNSINNVTSHQQNSSLASMYNNHYQDNRMAQNWGWNSSEMNQNYNMGGPNNYNQNNWQNF